ncbi:MAG: hypothetical protein D6704_13235 [Nitrospirae bacterium]|nr:MAG: hypothetical protein D6704_13235 [Nitrospirota bacterium]
MELLETFIQTAVLEPLQIMGSRLLAFVPNLLAMVVILLIGVFLSWLGAHLVERILRVLRIDPLSQRLGLTAALVRGGVKIPPSMLAGRIVYWVIMSLSIVAALTVLRWEPVNKLTESLFAYIPYFLTALFIIAGGFLLSNFVAQAVLIAAVNASLPPARLLASCTRWGIQLAAIAMALEQLGIAETIVVVGFGIAFGGVVLATAIAFGLGAKDLAKSFLERRFSPHPEERSQDDLRHL